MPKFTLSQHKGQAFSASRNIEAEAAEIAKQQSVPMEVAIEMVFANPYLLRKCHETAPRMGTVSPTWADPNNEPK